MATSTALASHRVQPSSHFPLATCSRFAMINVDAHAPTSITGHAFERQNRMVPCREVEKSQKRGVLSGWDWDNTVLVVYYSKLRGGRGYSESYRRVLWPKQVADSGRRQEYYSHIYGVRKLSILMVNVVLCKFCSGRSVVCDLGCVCVFTVCEKP